MRKIAEFTDTNGCKSEVYYDRDWQEYVVRFYNHSGIHMEASDYHTYDKRDALKNATP